MNREQKKARFNFVDVLILLVVLAIIGAAIYLVVSELGSRKITRQNGNMSFTVRISSVDEEALSLFAEGVIVKDSVTGTQLGNIVSVSTENSFYYGSTAVMDPDGGDYILPVSVYSNKYDVYVTIRTEAELDERGIHYVGDTQILVGSTVYFRIPSFASVSYITNFTPITAAG